MERRKAMKIAAGAIIGGGAGIFTLTNAFKPDLMPLEESKKIEFKNPETNWAYHSLDPVVTAELAYKYYDSGSCMYATCKSIISQLSDRFGEPYSSFPVHMMKYGHGGIGGFGTICGALNAAAALVGLFITDKTAQDNLITDILRWYEQTELPVFKPQTPIKDFTPPPIISISALCHASNANWTKGTGYKINSDERKEKCRRLTSDVVSHLVVVLNMYFSNTYITNLIDTEPTRECMTCHSDKGKIKNTSAKMTCDPCHSVSVGHKVFADTHYKLMK